LQHLLPGAERLNRAGQLGFLLVEVATVGLQPLTLALGADLLLAQRLAPAERDPRQVIAAGYESPPGLVLAGRDPLAELAQLQVQSGTDRLDVKPPSSRLFERLDLLGVGPLQAVGRIFDPLRAGLKEPTQEAEEVADRVAHGSLRTVMPESSPCS